MDKVPGTCHMHNVRFYNLSPRSINRMAYNKLQSKLALSRNDATIEIWNMTAAPFVEKTIFCSTEYDSVEDLKWAGNRLFSVGFNDFISEWNLKTCQVLQKSTLVGSNAWCLDVNGTNTQIAVGTEEGYINILSVVDSDLTYEKVFDKQEGRIVSCCFDKTGQYLVTGSLDAIRVWNIQSGHAIHKIGTGRSAKNRETIVWALAVLSDFTIVAGDSRGRLSFFDGNMGTQLESINLSKADILCIAVDDEEQTLVCSGVDPMIKQYTNVNVKKEGVTRKRWVRDISRSLHQHDVRSIVSLGPKCISGGIDGHLTVSSFPPKQVHRYGPFLQAPSVCVAQKARLILLKYVNYLEIWRMGTAASTKIEFHNHEDPNVKRQVFELQQHPEKMLELRSKHDENVVCTALSSDGRWLAYANISTIRLFRFQAAVDDGITSTIAEVKDVPKKYFTPCRSMVFSDDDSTLFLVQMNNKIDALAVTEDGVKYLYSIADESVFQSTINLIAVSTCGGYVACAATCNTVAIWQISRKKQPQLVKKFPHHICPATAIAFQPDQPILTVAYADHDLLRFDITEQSLKKLHLTDSKLGAAQPIVNICFDVDKPEVMIVHNDTALCTLQPGSAKQSGKKKKRVQTGDNVAMVSKVVQTYKHLVHVGWTGDKELVAVEVNSMSLIEQLPAVLKQKKFGAS